MSLESEPASRNKKSCLYPLLISLILFLIWLLFYLGVYICSFIIPSPNFTVSSLSVSLTNINNMSSMSSPVLTANWYMNVSVENPHWYVDYVYENVEPLILYRDVSLANTWLRPFHLDDHESFAINFAASSLPIDRYLADELVSDWRNGMVEFTSIIKATSRVRRVLGPYIFQRSKKKVDVVSHKDIKVAFLSNHIEGINIES